MTATTNPTITENTAAQDNTAAQHNTAAQNNTAAYGLGSQAPTSRRPARRHSVSKVAIASGVCGAVIAGLAAALIVSLSGGSSHTSVAPTTHTTHITPATVVTVPSAPVVIHTTPAPANPANHTNPPHNHPAVQPSAAVETLQRELGQLNYYEGPIDGLMGPQTVAAITYLQRDAGLPQTGQMNAQTQAALARMLATGNNQMGGNANMGGTTPATNGNPPPATNGNLPPATNATTPSGSTAA